MLANSILTLLGAFLSLVTLGSSEEQKIAKFPDTTPVILLNCDNFDSYTKLGKSKID